MRDQSVNDDCATVQPEGVIPVDPYIIGRTDSPELFLIQPADRMPDLVRFFETWVRNKLGHSGHLFLDDHVAEFSGAGESKANRISGSRDEFVRLSIRKRTTTRWGMSFTLWPDWATGISDRWR